MNPIQNKIFGKKKGKTYSPEDIDQAHHAMMKWYGWISLEEFMKLPEYTMFSLLNNITKEEEKESNKFRILIKAITGEDIGK